MLFRAVIFFLSRLQVQEASSSQDKTHFAETVCSRSAFAPSMALQGGQSGGSELRVDMGLRSCRSGCDFVAIFRLNLKAKFLQLALVKY